MIHLDVRRVSGFAGLFLFLLVVLPAAAQRSRGAYKDVKEMPQGPVGERLKELLRVYNADDPAQVRKLVTDAFTAQFRDAFPMDEHVATFAEVFGRNGQVEFYGVRKYDDGGEANETVAIVRSKLSDSWRGFTLIVEPDPPHLIAGLNFSPARLPSDLPPPKKLSESEMLDELKKLVMKLVDAQVFSGTVLVAKDGKVLFSGAYGLACREYNVANKLDTKFNLGSMNKMFTAVAVSQLAQQGKLSFDDKLGKYLSEDWLPRETLDKITIGQLLTHTSGLGSYFTDKFMKSSRAMYRVVDDYKPVVAEEELRFEPGADWGYSNTGFLLLGAVIEKVSGRSYFDYIRENIYKPAGMVNSDSYEMDRFPPNLAFGYSKEREGGHVVYVNNLYKHVIKGGPAGGGFSTVEDLLRFDLALRGHKLLNKEFTENLWTPKPKSPDYGYGFGLSGAEGNRIVGHGGGFPGIASDLDMYLDSGYTVAVMSNYDEGSRAIAQKLREWLTAK